MTKPHIVQVANLVVDALASEDAQDGMAIKFVPERQWVARRGKDEMGLGQAYVDVLHDSEQIEMRTRDSTSLNDYGVQVVIRGRIDATGGNDSVEQADRLMLVAEQIKDYLRHNKIAEGLALVRIEQPAIFDTDAFKDHNVFTAGPVFIYRAQRN